MSLDDVLVRVGAVVDRAQARDREVRVFREQLAGLPSARGRRRHRAGVHRGEPRGVLRRIRARVLHTLRTRAAWAELTRGDRYGE